MAPGTQGAVLADIPVDRIRPNPANPRLTFRQGELDELQESIRVYGVQVPIAVYKDGKDYVLIDGERRWRCVSKLNKKTIPALVQPKPSDLQNLLLMFNIHSLREQWDLLTVALTLPSVIELLQQSIGKTPVESDISSATGLQRGTIRRCKLLMDMPPKYTSMLLEELKKPKPKQRLSEDLFIEMERAIKTVARAVPGVIKDKDRARDVIISKYDRKVINGIVDLRLIAKIARAEKVGADPAAAKQALTKLFTDNGYTIESAFQDSVAEAYSERDIVTRIDSLISRFHDLREEELDDDTRDKLVS